MGASGGLFALFTMYLPPLFPVLSAHDGGRLLLQHRANRRGGGDDCLRAVHEGGRLPDRLDLRGHAVPAGGDDRVAAAGALRRRPFACFFARSAGSLLTTVGSSFYNCRRSSILWGAAGSRGCSGLFGSGGEFMSRLICAFALFAVLAAPCAGGQADAKPELLISLSVAPAAAPEPALEYVLLPRAQGDEPGEPDPGVYEVLPGAIPVCI